MNDSDINRRITYSIGLVSAAALFVAGVYAYAFFHFADGTQTNTPEALGQLGDYFGGTLNPILSACTFLFLVLTFNVQRQELTATRSALAKAEQAQQTQTRSALISNQLAALNARLTALTDELSHKRDMRNLWITLGSGDNSTKAIGIDGQLVDLPTAIRNATTDIDNLETRQNELIGLIDAAMQSTTLGLNVT